jgi:glycosyltransferase 2 family protein
MNKNIILALKIILSGILLAYLLTIIPLNDIINSILSAKLFLFLTGLLLVFPISYLSAVETGYLTGIQGIKLSVIEILKVHLATNFYGLFLPGVLSAGAVKWYKFSKYGKKSAAAAVVVFNRFLEILMILFIGIISSSPILYSIGNQKLLFVIFTIFVCMIIFYFLLLKKSGLKFVEKIIFFIPLPGFIRDISIKFTDAMHQFQNLRIKDHFEIIGLLFLYHGIGILSFFCFAKSLDINLSIWEIGWIRSAMSLAIMLPLSFAGLGIREGTLVFILGQYGVKPDISMALSFLFFFRNILTALFGGLIELKEFVITKKNRDTKSINTVGE